MACKGPCLPGMWPDSGSLLRKNPIQYRKNPLQNGSCHILPDHSENHSRNTGIRNNPSDSLAHIQTDLLHRSPMHRKHCRENHIPPVVPQSHPRISSPDSGARLPASCRIVHGGRTTDMKDCTPVPPQVGRIGENPDGTPAPGRENGRQRIPEKEKGKRHVRSFFWQHLQIQSIQSISNRSHESLTGIGLHGEIFRG